MCDFHSTAWRLLGQEVQCAHLPNNSHAESIEAAGWRVNEPNRTIIVFEAEWDGEGEFPADGKLIRNLRDCPDMLVEAIRRHYAKLREALDAGKHVTGAGYFCAEKWLDVLEKAATRFSVAFPQSIGDSLYLSGLTSAKDLVLPQSIGGSLDLSGLTSAKDLVLPQSIGDSLDLRGLTSAKGLVLPQSIGGSLDLRGLTSAKGLVLPQSIGGSLDLSGLTSADKQSLRSKYPKLASKI